MYHSVILEINTKYFRVAGNKNYSIMQSEEAEKDYLNNYFHEGYHN